jgi:glucose-6-phosphate-specific signal transduction histidine kinase
MIVLLFEETKEPFSLWRLASYCSNNSLRSSAVLPCSLPRTLQLEVEDEFLTANFLIDAVFEFIGLEGHVLGACSLVLCQTIQPGLFDWGIFPTEVAKWQVPS